MIFSNWLKPAPIYVPQLLDGGDSAARGDEFFADFGRAHNFVKHGQPLGSGVGKGRASGVETHEFLNDVKWY